MLTTIFERLRPPPKSDPWVGTRLEWVHSLSRVDAGRVGAELYVAVLGGRVVGRNASHDVEHEDKLIEAKLATRSLQNGATFRYQWNAFRKADPWTHAWLVAVSFDRVRAFLVPRSAIDLKNAKGSLQAYWAGNDATHDTATPPDWLGRHEIKVSESAPVP